MDTPPNRPIPRTAPRSDAFAADSFHLEIDGVSKASFTTCSGLESSVSVFEYAEGGAAAPRKLRGEATFSNVVLERGMTRDRDIHQWFSRGDRREVAIVLVDRAGREVFRWALARAWPCRWVGPGLDARTPVVAIETVEIAHEGFQCLAR